MEFGYWRENFSTWSGFVENNITTHAEGHAFFSFDRIETVGDLGSFWIHPEFEETVISETGDKKVIINADGLLAEVPKDGHSTIPHFTKSSIVTPEDWKREKENRFSVDHPDRILDVEALKKAHPPDRDYPLGIYCGSMIGKVRDLLTFEGLAYAIYDYPEMVEDIVDTACRLVEHVLDQVLPEIVFDYASGWEDIAFKNGPIVSVDFFKSVVVPRYKRINGKLKDYGIDIWYTDCDGDVRPLLPGFLESGINTLFPFEVNGCSHPGELLDEYQGELRIMGGVDKTKLIAGPEETKKYLESLLPYVERGGYIPFCDHRCPPDVTYENYLYYLDLKESMFGMG
jgi:uroporphyrinogen decarboxylase